MKTYHDLLITLANKKASLTKKESTIIENIEKINCRIEEYSFTETPIGESLVGIIVGLLVLTQIKSEYSVLTFLSDTGYEIVNTVISIAVLLMSLYVVSITLYYSYMNISSRIKVHNMVNQFLLKKELVKLNDFH